MYIVAYAYSSSIEPTVRAHLKTQEEVDHWIARTIRLRPTSSLFVNGQCVYTGDLTDTRTKHLEQELVREYLAMIYHTHGSYVAYVEDRSGNTVPTHFLSPTLIPKTLQDLEWETYGQPGKYLRFFSSEINASVGNKITLFDEELNVEQETEGSFSANRDENQDHTMYRLLLW